MRLRHLVQVNPPQSEVAHLPGDTEVVFAPMEALADGLGGLDTSTIRPLDEVRGGSYSYFAEGDLLLAKVTPCFENGKKAIATNLPTRIGFATSEVHVVRVKSSALDQRYLNYVFCSDHFRFVGVSNMTGAGGLRRVPEDAILNYRLPISDLALQRRIADFLDRETARIDHVIIAKRRLMTLLEEKRLATITYAVTRGVSRNGVVDPAGGERVDMVPLDWQVIRFRRVIKRIEQGWSPPSENRPVQPGEWGVLKVGCVNRGRFRPEEHKALPPGVEPRPELEVRDGDLLMSRGNTHDLVGSAAIASNTPPRLMLSDLLYRLVLDERVVRPRFAMYALNGYPLRSQIEACASGSSDSMPKISQEKIKELTWAVPPLVEQDAVIAYLDSHLERIDQLLEVIDRSVRCLEEFRSALITAAVTGQIDPDTWHKRGETDRRLEAIEAEVNQ